MLDVIQLRGEALKYTSNYLSGNDKLVIKAVKENGNTL